MSVSREERWAIFQKAWDMGNGFRFMFWTFGDITTDPAANEEACEFIREKIGEIVKDPEKAKKLKPTEYYARRPLCDAGYYEQFNKDNVDIVALKEEPIESITEGGIKTSKQHYDLDVLIFGKLPVSTEDQPALPKHGLKSNHKSPLLTDYLQRLVSMLLTATTLVCVSTAAKTNPLQSIGNPMAHKHI